SIRILHNCIIVPFPIEQLKHKSTFSLQNAGSKHNFLNHGLPLNLAIKPYLALKGSVAFPAENEVQNTESTQEKREIGDEENSAKFPIGRRDFDKNYTQYLSGRLQQKYHRCGDLSQFWRLSGPR
uniref:Pro-MCH n=1 Tax=Bos indicus x Bos taurus TaxID=30522 RepID=A0A4W2ILG5_BOBOX